MPIEKPPESEQRKHGFVVTRTLTTTELKIFTSQGPLIFELLDDQLMWLHQQVSDIMFKHFTLVPR